MPSDLDPLYKADTQPLPRSSSHQQHARDNRELVTLRATIISLLEEIRCSPGQAPTGARPSGADRRKAKLAQLAVPVVGGARRVGQAGASEHKPQAEFLGMLAHELRNPLQSMAMANGLLGGTEQSSPAVVQAHGVLDRQLGHMSRLLDDLLDASRVATGKIVVQRVPVRLLDVINAAVETSQPNILRRRQYLQVNVPDTGITVIGDLIRLAQAISNLLINASQFTDMDGHIAVVAQCKDAFVEIAVSDDGTGIPVDLQPFIFDMFTQGPRTLERAPGGLGLGLSLVNTIVRLHGGTSAVSSAGIGAGSRFTVTLPLAQVRPTAAPPPPIDPVAATRHILIIEDNVDANQILGMLLEMGGHKVTSSFDGLEGLRLAVEGQFDIVLCDLGLPGLTGLEVVAALKAARQHDAPFVIATTGYSDDAQRDLARAAGFDHYAVKPLDLPALFKVIAEYAG